MPTKVDLNADMGESYGRWTLGDGEALMPHLTSANIACGFHGGDPHVLRRTVDLALEHGVGIGAHVAYPDLIGFGRRRLSATPAEVGDYVLYQAGAVKAFAEAAGGRLQRPRARGREHLRPRRRAERTRHRPRDQAGARGGRRRARPAGRPARGRTMSTGSSAVIARQAGQGDGKPSVTYRYAGDRAVLIEYGEMVFDL